MPAGRLMSLELGDRLMNTQFAIRGDEVYVLEVNPRASRTVPFVSKATGVPLAAIAAKVMAGKTLKELGFTREIIPNFFSIKEAVFPFMKFPGVDPILGPEMRSTGEVMGIGWSFGGARAKAMKAANYGLPKVGKAFLSVRDADKQLLIPIARELVGRGYQLVATRGTCDFLVRAPEAVNKSGRRSAHCRPDQEPRDQFHRQYHRRTAGHFGPARSGAGAAAKCSLHHHGGWRRCAR
jgi:carbamoyl-phosphate synthase large subunit